jgi:hypothetical protein
MGAKRVSRRVWSGATPPFSRQVPRHSPPSRTDPTSKTNLELDKTWGATSQDDRKAAAIVSSFLPSSATNRLWRRACQRSQLEYNLPEWHRLAARSHACGRKGTGSQMSYVSSCAGAASTSARLLEIDKAVEMNPNSRIACYVMIVADGFCSRRLAGVP